MVEIDDMMDYEAQQNGTRVDIVGDDLVHFVTQVVPISMAQVDMEHEVGITVLDMLDVSIDATVVIGEVSFPGIILEDLVMDVSTDVFLVINP